MFTSSPPSGTSTHLPGPAAFGRKSMVGMPRAAWRPGPTGQPEGNGARVQMPRVAVRPGGYRFLPDGTGLIYLPSLQAIDFWLLDLATQRTRQLTRLRNKGAVRTFDITPDGKHIVFDRSRENSDIVVIDLPR